MEDDIIKVMKNLVTKIERERHQAQLQEEGIVWNQLKPVWKEKYWEEMLRGLRDDPNRESEEYEEKQWKEEQDRRLIPILFYQYANDKTEVMIRVHKQSLMKAKAKLKELTARNQGRNIRVVMNKVKVYVSGWLNYYCIASIRRKMQEWDEWLRRRYRQYIWKS